MIYFSFNYENFLLIGEFNVGLDDTAMKDFCNLYNLRSLIDKPTFYKNPANSSCIELLLTNCSKYFHNSNVIETGLSNFHKMIVTMMKKSYRKLTEIMDITLMKDLGKRLYLNYQMWL